MTLAVPRLSRTEFDADWYLRVNSDVKAAGVDAWDHYVRYGFSEGRAGAPVRALELDHLLWRGFSREAEAELRLLLRHGTPHQRAMAGWVMARHAASRGRWHTAHDAISRFVEAPDAAQYITHVGPWLLAIQSGVRSGNIATARRAHRQAVAHFCTDPKSIDGSGDKSRALSRSERELHLGLLEIELARGAPRRRLEQVLAALHAGTGLGDLSLKHGPAAHFDRLTVRNTPAAVTDGPLVSVVVPSHNAAHTITTCLRGLMAQSWRNLEIIVVDDCSRDATADIVAALARKDLRLRLVRLPANGGAYVARNTGFEQARGVFFTVQDADDWSHPQKIAEQVAPLLQDPAVMATVSHWVRADDDLRMTRWRMEDGWCHRNVSSLMIRTALRDTLGYWDRIRANADTEYYHRLLTAYGPAALKEVHPGVPLSFGRTHAQSLTATVQSSLATQFSGPRRSHMNAALHWHQRQIADLPDGAPSAARAQALHMPAQPKERAFFAPPELGPSEPCSAADDYARLAASPLFDSAWYLRRYPDVRDADADTVGHYLAHGTKENRDAGPLFPTAAWREHAPSQGNPLLWMTHQGALPVRAPARAGALPREDRPVVLVFAHSADLQIFGAERSLLITLERLANGYGGRRYAPVAVLPSAVNQDYLAAVAARSVAVEILPQVWRHRFRDAPPKTVEAIRSLIREYTAKEVHVNTLVLDAPLIAARQEGCVSVVHVRELPAQDEAMCRILGNTPQGLRRHLLKGADHFIANSTAVAAWLDCPERSTIWPNAVDPALFDLPFAPGAGLRIGMISSNIAKKGIADFARVAELVAQMEDAAELPPHQRCAFNLIGPETADLAALCPLPANLRHSGYAETPVAALTQCDLVLVLSHFAESFGRTALEAMAAGRPVICYDRGTPPSFITHGTSGIVTPPDDPHAVAKAVCALSLSRADLLEMSAQARDAAGRLNLDSGRART